MPVQQFGADYEPRVQITDFSMVERLGETAMLGNWFVVLQTSWLDSTGMAQILEQSNGEGQHARPTIAFRDKEVTVPGLCIDPTPLDTDDLVLLDSHPVLDDVGTDA